MHLLGFSSTNGRLTLWALDIELFLRSKFRSENAAAVLQAEKLARTDYLHPTNYEAVLGLVRAAPAHNQMKTGDSKTTAKILHVAYSGLGGHGSVLFSLLDSSFGLNYTSSILFVGTEEIRREYIDKSQSRGCSYEYIRKEKGLDVSFLCNLYRHFRDCDADILFLHGSTQIVPAFLSNIFSHKKKKLVVRETQANHLKNFKDKTNLLLALLVTQSVVVLSSAFLDDVQRRYGFLGHVAKMQVIPNGIDLSKFFRSPKKLTQKVLIGMQSRLVKIKDHTTLIEAFALLVQRESLDIHLQLAGDGEYLPDLQALVAKLGLEKHVDFLGTLSEEPLVEFLQSLTVYVHASLGECLSTALLQAMACGVPVVASDVVGINNMLSHGVDGLLVEPRNPTALAESIRLLLENPTLAQTLSNNSIQLVGEKFSNEIMAKRYLHLLNQ